MFDLSKKSICVESVAKEALENDKVLTELFEGILSKKDTIRYNSFKVLLLISEENHSYTLLAVHDNRYYI